MEITAARLIEVDYIEVEMPGPDRSSCSSCDDARSRLDRAIKQVEPLLGESGTRIEVRELKVRTASDAELLRVRGSPTIRIAGVDLHPEHGGSEGEDRVWWWRGVEYPSPPVELFAEALLTAPRSMIQTSTYELPSYLRRFVLEESAA